MHGAVGVRILLGMVPVLLLLSQLSLSPTKVVTVTTPDGEASCWVALPQSGRVRMFKPHAAAVWPNTRSERLILTEGTSLASVYDDTTKSWSDRRYVVRRVRQVGAVKREVPRACIIENSRVLLEETPGAPFCEAKWTVDGQRELEVPVGEECLITIDGISRVAV